MNIKRLIVIFFVNLLLTSVYADKVSVGDSHTMFITTDGTLWACGFNQFRGALGDGTLVDRNTPIKIKEHVSHVSAGRYHSLFITEDGTLWGCGNASNGELGIEVGDHTATPVKIMTGVKTATAGGGCSYIIKYDGSLWACGNNEDGQLGDGTLEDRKIPVKIMDDVANVSAGQSHVLILKTDGSVWSCGRNNAGCLGDGSEDNSSSPLKIMDDVEQISAGLWHSLMIKTDGSLWGCGGAFYEELGKGEDFRATVPVKLMEDVAFASAGQWCSMVIKRDGSLWVCGYNETGMLGTGTTDNVDEFQKVLDGVARVYTGSNSFHTAIVKKDGTLLTCGSNSFGQLGNGIEGDQATPLNVMSGVKETSTRLHHSLILRTDNSLWGCGNNNHGQLGDGTTISKSNPVRIAGGVTQLSAGYFHTMFIKNDGTLWGCGLNESGQLGDGTTENKLTPVKVMDDVKQVSAGGHHTMILKMDGSLWACGYNSDGRLGTGSTSEVPMSTPVKVMDDVEKVYAGDYHTMIIKTDGSLMVCGNNGYGRLGDGSGKNQATPVKIMDDVAYASGGRCHSLFVKKDGTLWACGYNGDGQLGDGTTENKKTPVWIMDEVSQVSAAGYHSLILKKDGELLACGRNLNGECGCGSTGGYYPTPERVMNNVIYISAAGSAGDEHSLFVTSDNHLYACGSRTYGQLGDGRSEVLPGEIMKDVVFVKTIVDGIEYSLDDEYREGAVKQIQIGNEYVSVPEQLEYKGNTFIVTEVGDSIFKNVLETKLGAVSFPKTIKIVSEKTFDVYGANSIVWNSNVAIPSHAFSNNEFYKESNFLLYVNNVDLVPLGIKNVVVDGVAEGITLKDNYEFYCPKDFSVKKISYCHNYTMETGNGECAGWETIALPFNVQDVSHEMKGALIPFAAYSKSSGKKPFWLFSLGSSGFTEASSIIANTPYLISMPNNNNYGSSFNVPGKVTFSADNTIVYCTSSTNLKRPSYGDALFLPSFSFGEKNNSNYVMNANNDYVIYYGTEKPGSVFVSNYRICLPFECHFYKSGVNSRILNIPFTNEYTTGIDSFIEGKRGISIYTIYDAKGTPVRSISNASSYEDAVEGLPSGVYIINGKKVIK